MVPSHGQSSSFFELRLRFPGLLVRIFQGMFRLQGIHLSCKILEVLEWWREGAEGGGGTGGGFYGGV